MNDHFFHSYPGANFNRSKSQVNLNNIHRPSLFNLSGENIVYNKNNGLNKKKLSVKSYLKNDNLLAHKKLDEIKNEYHNMRNFLNDKVSKLEEQQQLQFENLRNYLQANNQIEKMKYEEKYKNNFLNEIKEQMDYDYNRKKKLEKLRNIAIAEKLGEQRYIEEMERKKLLQEMVYFKKIHLGTSVSVTDALHGGGRKESVIHDVNFIQRNYVERRGRMLNFKVYWRFGRFKNAETVEVSAYDM